MYTFSWSTGHPGKGGPTPSGSSLSSLPPPPLLFHPLTCFVHKYCERLYCERLHHTQPSPDPTLPPSRNHLLLSASPTLRHDFHSFRCFLGARCCAMMLQALPLILTALRQALLFGPILQRSKLRPRSEVLYPRPHSHHWQSQCSVVGSAWLLRSRPLVHLPGPGVSSDRLLPTHSPSGRLSVNSTSQISPFCPHGHLSRTAAGRP